MYLPHPSDSAVSNGPRGIRCSWKVCSRSALGADRGSRAGVRRRSAAFRLVGLRVRVPPAA